MLASQPTSTSHPVAWVVDSGATHHMCNDREAFRKNSLGPARATVRLGDMTSLTVKQQGVVAVNGVDLKALFIPEFRVSLLSVAQLDAARLMTSFANRECTISDLAGITFIQARLSDGLYRVSGAASDAGALIAVENTSLSARALVAIAAARRY